MKIYQLRMVWIFIAVVSVCGMCNKNHAPSNNPPGEIKVSKGFLATMAPRSSGQLDTVAIKNGGAFNLSRLSEAAISNGTFEKPGDVWQVANDGSRHWYFKRGDGKYLSIGDAQTGGYDWDTSPQILRVPGLSLTKMIRIDIILNLLCTGDIT
jgi:hypothetical protein